MGTTDLSVADLRQRREVIILANPTAGARRRRRQVHDLVEALEQRGLRVLPCWDREALDELVRQRADQVRCVVAAGGDGTLNEVINRAAGLPVALLPLGTENLMARHFRLGRSPRRLADAIARVSVRRLDLARGRGRLFSLMAGVGIDAEVVHEVHGARRGHINHLSYLLPALRALWRYSFPVVEVEVVDTGERLRGVAVFLFNLPVYGGGLPIGAGARGDDGWLDLLVFQRPGLVNLARYLEAILSGGRLPDLQRRRVKRVRLWSDQPVPVQVDGDPAGVLPLDIEVVPGALRLVVPGEDQRFSR